MQVHYYLYITEFKLWPHEWKKNIIQLQFRTENSIHLESIPTARSWEVALPVLVPPD